MIRKLAIALWFVASATRGEAAIDMMGRHVFFLHGGVDEVKGSYMFLVNNTGPETETTTIRIMLPHETVDWFPHEGIEQNELKPGPEGGLVLTKAFPPGESFISLGFIVPGSGGESRLTFKPAFDVGSLALFAKGDLLNIGPTRDGFEFRSDVEFSGQNYDTLSRGNIKAGETISLIVTGVPEGRGRLWALGAFFAVFMLAIGTVLAIRTKPKEVAEESV